MNGYELMAIPQGQFAGSGPHFVMTDSAIAAIEEFARMGGIPPGFNGTVRVFNTQTGLIITVEVSRV